MSRFDEFVDEFVFMAKNAADVASKKTGEVVEIGKLKYQQKQAEWDLEKAYAKLGAIYYESQNSHEDFKDAIFLAGSEIDELKEKIKQTEESIRAYRKLQRCDKCGADNEVNALFCSRCGSPVSDAPIDATPPAEPDKAGAPIDVTPYAEPEDNEPGAPVEVE